MTTFFGDVEHNLYKFRLTGMMKRKPMFKFVGDRAVLKIFTFMEEIRKVEKRL